MLAVNHYGNSDSTGAITGNLAGCLHGFSRIPGRWLEPLEMRELMIEVADDLATARDWDFGSNMDSSESEFYLQRYPPN